MVAGAGRVGGQLVGGVGHGWYVGERARSVKERGLGLVWGGEGWR